MLEKIKRQARIKVAHRGYRIYKNLLLAKFNDSRLAGINHPWVRVRSLESFEIFGHVNVAAVIFDCADLED